MPKVYDVVATTGEYEKSGQTKRKYATVGMVIEKEGKLYLKLNSLVTVHDNGSIVNFFSLYEPKSSQETAAQGVQQARNQIIAKTQDGSVDIVADFDDDIPF